MKKTVEIKKLGINGEGIGYIERKIVFVPGALIGEEVEIEITKQTRNFLEAKLIKVHKPSKDRVEKEHQVVDFHTGSLAHMKYSSQLRYKKEAIRESLRKYTSYDLTNTVFKDVVKSKKLEGFVTSVNLPIVYFKGQITFGIYQRDTKDLTIMTKYFKHDPMINDCLQKVSAILTENGCRTYNDKMRLGLRFLKMKKVNDEIQIVFITGKNGIEQKVIDAIANLSYVTGIFVSVNTSRYQDFEESGYRKVFGNTRLSWHYEDNKYLFSVKSDFPDNMELYQRRNQEILKMIEDSQKIISIHCSVGILELSCAQEVLALDEKNYHIEDAKLNKRGLRKENVSFVKGDIDDKIETYAKKKIYDTFVIQNGRFGLSEKVKESIRLSKVKHVIYCCDSHSTLAKDLADLERYYDLDKVVALDTFVYTPYVTTIVKLTRK